MGKTEPVVPYGGTMRMGSTTGEIYGIGASFSREGDKM